eukprot:Rhum_TRINITY_DN14506_c20_g1::Rhum_TRINITY_DN14506_c20_g1_i1::g.95513::m.95513
MVGREAAAASERRGPGTGHLHQPHERRRGGQCLVTLRVARNSQTNGNAGSGDCSLHLPYAHLVSVEDASRQRGVRVCLPEHLGEVVGVACARGGNHRDRDVRLHVAHKSRLEALVLPVVVDAVEQDLAGAELLRRLRKRARGEVDGFAASLRGALVPALRLAVRARGQRLERLALNGLLLVDALRVDGDDDGLRTVALGDGGDGARLAVELLRVRQVLQRRVHRVGAQRHLVGAGAEVLARHVDGAVELAAVGVREGADAAADAERHEDALRCLPQHLEHGLVLERRAAEGRDVQEGDLVGAVLVVTLRQLHRLAQVAHLTLCVVRALLTHVVLVALRHNDVAAVVRAHVEARDDPLRHLRLRLLLLPPVALLHLRLVLVRHLQEVLDQRKPLRRALLRVELRREHVALLHGGHDALPAVVGRREDPLRRRVLHVRHEGVHEVVVRLRVDQVRLLPDTHAVPADRRHGAAVLHSEPRDLARDDAEALNARGLLALLEERLHAEAHAEKRLACLDVVANRLHKAEVVQAPHRGAERSDTREDQAVSLHDLRGGGGHLHRPSEVLDGVDDAADIAGAVVDDGNNLLGHD